MKGPRLPKEEINKRIKHYCAYQERAHSEVRRKLYALGLYKDEVEEVIVQLIEEGFLNESRFAKTFAGGKFRIKKWGRLKIINSLEAKGVSRNGIKYALTEISEDEYMEMLKRVLDKKIESWPGKSLSPLLKKKLAQYAIGKGYEPEIVWAMINKPDTWNV